MSFQRNQCHNVPQESRITEPFLQHSSACEPITANQTE